MESSMIIRLYCAEEKKIYTYIKFKTICFIEKSKRNSYFNIIPSAAIHCVNYLHHVRHINHRLVVLIIVQRFFVQVDFLVIDSRFC